METLAHPLLSLCVFSLVAQAPLDHSFSLDLALGLWVVRCAADMIHALFVEIIRRVPRDVRRAVAPQEEALIYN